MARPSPETTTGTVPWYKIDGALKTSGIRVVANATRREWSGTVTSDYYHKVNVPGALPVNRHSVKISTRKEFPIYRRHTLTGWPNINVEHSDTFNQVTGESYPDSTGNIVHSTQAYERAMRNAMANTKDMKVNVAQAVAEAQRTMDLVADTAKRLAQTVHELRRGKIGKAMKTLGLKTKAPPASPKLHDQWLALQYGWLPLLSDVTGAAQKLAQRQFPPVFKFYGRSSAKESRPISRWTSSQQVVVSSYELQYKSDAEVMLSFCMRNHTARTLSSLGISDPLLVAWEILPWSFVADWFLPVGDYLSNLNYCEGLTFKIGHVVQFTQNAWVVSNTAKLYVNGINNYQYRAGNLLMTTNILFNRDFLVAAPKPILPRLQNPLKPTRMLNAIALLHKSFR